MDGCVVDPLVVDISLGGRASSIDTRDNCTRDDATSSISPYPPPSQTTHVDNSLAFATPHQKNSRTMSSVRKCTNETDFMIRYAS